MRILSSLVLASTIILFGAACSSDSEDPAASNGGSGAGGSGAGGSGATGGGEMGGSSSGATGGSAMGGTGGGSQVACPPPADEIFWQGQVTAPEDIAVPKGGVFTTDPAVAAYADAGLQAIIDQAAPLADDMPTAVDIDISGVTVTASKHFTDQFAISPNKSLFWIADSNGGVEVRLDFDDMACCSDFDMRVGHKLSFKVTEIAADHGKPQITKVTGWTLDSADNPVYVKEASALTVDDLFQVVRITGRVGGAGEACGGDSRCWDLTVGTEDILYRSESDFTKAGNCMTWVGPVSTFQGAPQLNEDNFDWVWTY